MASIFLYGLGWRTYERFLRKIEADKERLSLWKELPQVLFLGVTPIGFLLAFSPAVQLASYPAALDIEAYGGALVSTAVIVHFLYRTRKIWRKNSLAG